MGYTNVYFEGNFNALCLLLKEYKILESYSFDIEDNKILVWNKGEEGQYPPVIIGITKHSIQILSFCGKVRDAISEPFFSFDKLAQLIFIHNNENILDSREFGNFFHFAFPQEVLKYGFRDPHNIPEKVLNKPIYCVGKYLVEYGVSEKTVAKFIEFALDYFVGKENPYKNMFKDIDSTSDFLYEFINN